jgi:hypothetical protein
MTKTNQTIRNLRQLAEHVGANHTRGSTEELKRSIAHRLYKDTECGISFYTPPDGKWVTVSGYCEGSDAEHPSYKLTFPFAAEEFDKAVEKADQDGVDEWDATHGCDDCETEECDGRKPVDPNCKGCGGAGQII